MADVHVLLVGSTQRREFRDAQAALESLAVVTRAVELEDALAKLAAGEVIPDVIVIAQAFPGRFSHQAVDQLRMLAPLAPIVGLMGSWCEGEVRTGKPWPAAVRVYWHQWPARAARQIERLRQGLCSAWGLPSTASEEERFLGLVEAPSARPQVARGNGQGANDEGQTTNASARRGSPDPAETAYRQVSWQDERPSVAPMARSGDRPQRNVGLIAIHSPSFEMQDWLATACRQRGHATVWLRPGRSTCVRGVQAALFDATECHREEAVLLSHLAARVRPAPVIALLDFPRIDDRDRALSAGAAAVLSKPLLIDDLFWQLQRLARNVE